MNCEEVKELLSAFQDRELSVEEMTGIQEHLQDCADCAAKSNVITNLSRIVKHWEGVKASETARRKLLDKAVSGQLSPGRSVSPALLWILGMLTAALLGGGIVALGYWYANRGGPVEGARGGRGPAPLAACVAVEGRVELVQPGGERLDVRGRRDLSAGQEIFCDSGSAAQIELTAGKSPALVVLRGSGSLRILRGEVMLKGGTLVFRVPPGASLTAAVGSWKVEVSGGTTGLAERKSDGGVRLAVLGGGARLTSGGDGGLSVGPGREIVAHVDGRVDGPRELSDAGAFDMLKPVEGGREGR